MAAELDQSGNKQPLLQTSEKESMSVEKRSCIVGKDSQPHNSNFSVQAVLLLTAVLSILSAVFYTTNTFKWKDQLKQEVTMMPDVYECRHSYTVQVLSQNPFILYIEDFLQPGEAEHIKALAEPYMHRSGTTTKEDAHGSVVSDYRTSYSSSLKRNHTAVVSCIEERAAYLGDLPVEGIETLQVVRYHPGQQYKPHTDYLTLEQLEYSYWGQFGVRYATILAYIHDPEEGGDTTFTRAGISVGPRKNDALFWINASPDGTVNEETEHAGEPVIRGEKWAINIWMHRWDPAIRNLYKWKGVKRLSTESVVVVAEEDDDTDTDTKNNNDQDTRDAESGKTGSVIDIASQGGA